MQNVVETYEGLYESPTSWWFVQELAPSGSLRSLMEAHSGALPETLARHFLHQVPIPPLLTPTWEDWR